MDNNIKKNNTNTLKSKSTKSKLKSTKVNLKTTFKLPKYVKNDLDKIFHL